MSTEDTANTSRLLLAMMRNTSLRQTPDYGVSRMEWYKRSQRPLPTEREYAEVAHVAVLSDG